MRKYLFSRSAVPATFAAMAFLIPGQASADVATSSSCSAPAVAQSFLGWGDAGWYTPAPGVTPDSFSGAGWVLTGGAEIVPATLADGTTGLVLDLPPGSSATSPVTCVQTGEPDARMITRMVGTNAPMSGATHFYVTPVGGRLSGGMPVLSTAQWTESPSDNVFRGNGAEDVTFTYESTAKVGDLEVYDLYVDPRMRF